MSRLDERRYNPDTSAVFSKTKERFGGLSNMAPGFGLNVNGIQIRTSEALYQACRFPHRPDAQRQIIGKSSPMTAKMHGKTYRQDVRPDWDAVRVSVMRWCLRVKLAQNWEIFGKILLSTDNMPIVEKKHRRDFWGTKEINGWLIGMNVLGRLLMELREQLMDNKAAESLRTVEPLTISDFVLFEQPIETIYASESKEMSDTGPGYPPQSTFGDSRRLPLFSNLERTAKG